MLSMPMCSRSRRPDRVLHERAEDLAVEVVARRLGQLALGPEAVLLPQVVGVVQEERDPADLALDRDELQLGVALHDEPVDELGDRLGHRELAHHEAGHEPRRALVDARRRACPGGDRRRAARSACRCRGTPPTSGSTARRRSRPRAGTAGCTRSRDRAARRRSGSPPTARSGVSIGIAAMPSSRPGAYDA